jgi:hypothetical protein
MFQRGPFKRRYIWILSQFAHEFNVERTDPFRTSMGPARSTLKEGEPLACSKGELGQHQALGLKAAALIEAQCDNAFDVINDRTGPPVDRDLYITVIDRTGTMRASGFNKSLVGSNTWDAEDPDGMKFVQEFWKAVANDSKEGWLTYKFVLSGIRAA